MKRLLFIVLVLVILPIRFIDGSDLQKSLRTNQCYAEWVRGYYRSNGTWVNSYYRTNRDGNPYNNLSWGE